MLEIELIDSSVHTNTPTNPSNNNTSNPPQQKENKGGPNFVEEDPLGGPDQRELGPNHLSEYATNI